MNIGDRVSINEEICVIIEVREKGITKHAQVKVKRIHGEESYWVNSRNLEKLEE